MNKSKILIVFFCLLLLISTTFALTYRTELDNGSWSQYNTGLGSGFYQNELTGQTTYNRNFESAFALTNKVASCSSSFCQSFSSTASLTTANIETSSTEADEGTYSLKVNFLKGDSGGGLVTMNIFGKDEIVGDSNIVFSFKTTAVYFDTLRAGYVDDQNTFYPVLTLTRLVADWNTMNYYVPAGKYRLAFQYSATDISPTSQTYFDNIKVIRNNTGTFRSSDPQYCNSIASCSNIESHLPSSSLGNTYWVIDYVAGATCTWSKNGTAQGAMTEGTSGMYYVNTGVDITSGHYEDVNFSASCLKVPFAIKNFFVSPRLFRYGLIDGGSFEEAETLTNVTNNCGTYFCQIVAGVSTTAQLSYSTSYATDGVYSGKLTLAESVLAPAHTIVFYSKEQQLGSSEVSFLYKNVGSYWGLGQHNATTYGYVDDSNTYTAVGSLSVLSTDWNNVVYDIPSGNKRFAIREYADDIAGEVWLFDQITADTIKLGSTISGTNDLVSNFGLRGETYTFNTSYLNAGGLPITDATCNLIIDGTNYAMAYNSGTGLYSYSLGFASDSTLSVRHSCSSTSYNDGNTSYTIRIATPASQNITFTPIQNILSYSISDFTPNATINLSNNNDPVIFSVINNTSDYEITFDWTNTLNLTSKQYSIYTSTDGETWTFDDASTFGSSTNYNDPIQKLPLENGYKYSFTTTLINGTKIYYKFVFGQLPLSWQTIANSSDWVNVNQPTIYTDQNGNNWDLFADSTYTPINSYTDKQYPLLTSTDLETGFEIQFTAYADAPTTLKVGYVIDGSPYIHIIPVTTDKTRFSVPTLPTSSEARLIIYSDGNNTNVYVTDYAIVPKSYFTSRLEVFQNDGSPLNATIIGGESKVYLREGIGYKIKTSAFDRDADLERLRIEASIAGTTIKSKEFYLKDATSIDHIFTWNELIEGFVDYNGTGTDTRSIYIKATLCNSAEESVAQQSATVNILQYPYFQDDISFNIYSLNAKVSENPEIRFNITQKDYSQFIGIKIYIYDSGHSLADPNYSETILNSQLGCTSFTCSKNLKVDGYVFEDERQYFIAVQLILKTEAPSTTNPLTIKVFSQMVTFRQFETSRIFQVGERTDHTYRNDEKIQVVLQLRDVPYKNLSADTEVYINLDNCDADTEGNCANGTTKFYPKKFIYDETTGYNYYFFDQLFYLDSGALLPDGNYIRFRATITDSRYSHDESAIPIATLADKCASDSYGTLFNSDWFNMNFFDRFMDSTQRALFGCGTLSSAIVEVDDAEEKRLLIDADHNVLGGQNQSIACLKIDNDNFQNTLEQDLVCAVIWTKNQQSIDQFKITIGNEFSDYSKTGNSAQYLSFDIPAEQLIFSDQLMLAQSLQAEYGTDSLDTIGEVVFYGFDKLFAGVANPLTDVLEGVTKTGLITNIGFDVNWSNTFDPTFVKGMFFFKVKGLKVINQYDYINRFPELETTNPKYFREFANSKGLELPINNTLVNVYVNDLTNWNLVGDQIDSLETVSPLVIYAPTTIVQTGIDTNSKQVATILKFNLVSDMLSNNNTSSQRVFLPLTFSYVPPVKMLDFFGIIDEVLYGKDSAGNPAGLFTNPVGFGFKNWFWFLLGVIGILILSLIVRNFRTSGSKTIINNQGRGK